MNGLRTLFVYSLIIFCLFLQSCSGNKVLRFDEPYDGIIDIRDGVLFYYEDNDRVLHNKDDGNDTQADTDYSPYATGYRKLIPLEEKAGTFNPVIGGISYKIDYTYYTDKDGNEFHRNVNGFSSGFMMFDYFTINNGNNEDITVYLVEIRNSTAYIQLRYKGVYDVVTYDIKTDTTTYLLGEREPEKDYSIYPVPFPHNSPDNMGQYSLCAIEPGCVSPGGEYILYRRSKESDTNNGLYEYVVRSLITGEESIVYDKSLPPPVMSGHSENAQWLGDDLLRLCPVIKNDTQQSCILYEASVLDIYLKEGKWVTQGHNRTELVSCYLYSSWEDELRFRNVMTGEDYEFSINQASATAQLLMNWISEDGMSFSPSRMRGAIIRSHVLYLFDFETMKYHIKQLYDLKGMQHGWVSILPYFLDENTLMINTKSFLTDKGWNITGRIIEERNTAYFIDCGKMIINLE